jgi:2-hydroxy-3-keto-5-methylthiopentenyl-1-phosphate phosphatase
VFAAQARFGPRGIEARYIGPDGIQLQDDFKEKYTRLFLKRGYQIIYVGNGISDVLPASLAHRTFATSQMLTHCKKTNLRCTPFNDLNDVVRDLELSPPG